MAFGLHPGYTLEKTPGRKIFGLPPSSPRTGRLAADSSPPVPDSAITWGGPVGIVPKTTKQKGAIA